MKRRVVISEMCIRDRDTKKEKEEAKNPVFQMPVEGEIVKKFEKQI